MKLNWGNKLVIALVIFAGIMATMVTIAMRQNIDLVDKNYYKKELEYQDQIDKISNAIEDGAVKIALSETEPSIRLSFRKQLNVGRIHLFRPSNASEDRLINIQTDINGLQEIPYEELSSGLWKIKIDWSEDGKNYYYETGLNLP